MGISVPGPVSFFFRHTRSGDRAIVKISCNSLKSSLFFILHFPSILGMCIFPCVRFVVYLSLWYKIFMSRFVIICLEFAINIFVSCFLSLFLCLASCVRFWLSCKKDTHFAVFNLLNSMRHIKVIIFQASIWIILHHIQDVNKKIITMNKESDINSTAAAKFSIPDKTKQSAQFKFDLLNQVVCWEGNMLFMKWAAVAISVDLLHLKSTLSVQPSQPFMRLTTFDI